MRNEPFTWETPNVHLQFQDYATPLRIKVVTREAYDDLSTAYNNKQSRLDAEYIMAIVRNSSGCDSGEIDCSIKCDRFDRLRPEELKDALRMLEILKTRCEDRIKELS